LLTNNFESYIFVRNERIHRMKCAFHYNSVGKGLVASNNLVSNLFTKETVRHLVNESAQNSTDAAKLNFPGTPARLDFTIRKVARAALENFDISSVERHAAACSDKTIAKSLPTGDLRVLLFEDHSGGLSGPAGEDCDSSTPLGRYAFSVGSGVDGKSGSDNGRHGLGSGTGAMISKTRCMYFTSTRLDGTTIGSGRVSLSTHKLDGESFNSEARLGVIDGTNWKGLLQGVDADRMHRDFGFARDIGQPGLSCAVIEPLDEVNGYAILASIFSGQFIQIARGEIEFRVVDEVVGIDVTINAGNMDAVIGSEVYAAMEHSLSKRGRPTTQQGILADLNNILEFVRSHPDADSFPRIDPEKPSGLPPDMRRAWLDGNAIGVMFPVSAVHSETGDAVGTVSTWVKPLKAGTAGYDIHVRDSIVNIERTSGRLSLTTSQKDQCSVLFGDAEDPSHTHYRELLAQNRGWKEYRAALRAFKAAPSIILAAINGDAERGDRMALARFFPMPGNDLRSPSEGGSEEDESDDRGQIVVTGDGGSDDLFVYKTDRRSSSLSLTLSPTAKRACDAGEMSDVLITAEYAGSKLGFGSFTETNTTFSIERGAEEFSVSKNKLTVRGISSDLNIVIRNIDQNRDLRVRNEVSDIEDEEAA
jgi:hypothetical protein